jgi:hypothetical protein
VRLAASPAGFYGDLVEAANAFVLHDRDLAGLLLQVHGSRAVHVAER